MSDVIAEEWRPIVGYEGYYEISSLGRVRSLDRVVTYSNGHLAHYRGAMKVQSGTDGGYLHVGLSRDGVTVTHNVHVLVCRG